MLLFLGNTFFRDKTARCLASDSSGKNMQYKQHVIEWGSFHTILQFFKFEILWIKLILYSEPLHPNFLSAFHWRIEYLKQAFIFLRTFNVQILLLLLKNDLKLGVNIQMLTVNTNLIPNFLVWGVTIYILAFIHKWAVMKLPGQCESS